MTQFKKGHIPWTTGKKDFFKDEAGRQRNTASRFKVGHLGPGAKPIGSERLRGNKFVEIKVAQPSVWKRKSCWLWEQHNGPIPDGHFIIFKDGDWKNVTLDNLKLASPEDMAEIYLRPDLPEDLKQTYNAVVQLKAVIGKINKKNENSH